MSIKSTILEISSEDAYGSWELWWAVSSESKDSHDLLKKELITVIENLLKEKKLEVFRHAVGGEFKAVQFDPTRLRYELDNASTPDPDHFYWFATTELGEKEDMDLRSPSN